MQTRSIARSALLLLTLLVAQPAFGATDVARQVDVNQPAALARPPERAALGTPSEQERYAAREAASPEASKYRGGDTIVISVTAVAIVLLVVLVLILI
jgi:hypothetical protein